MRVVKVNFVDAGVLTHAHCCAAYHLANVPMRRTWLVPVGVSLHVQSILKP